MTAEPSVVVAERYARGATVAAVVIAGFWHLGYDSVVTVVNWGVYTRQWAAAAGWVLYLLVGVAGAVLLLCGGSRRWVWPLGVAALAVDVLLVLAAPAQVILPANWAWGAVGWVAVIVFWRHRAAHLVAFLALDTALLVASMVAVGVGSSQHISRAIMVLLGAFTLQLGYSVSAHGLRTAAGWAARDSAARTEATARQAAAEAVAEDRAQRYRELHRATATLLAELAAGADPADPAIRRRAAAGAARLRRLMAETDDVPDPLLHELRAGADVAERRGVQVSLSVVGTVPRLPVDLRRALTEAPIVGLSAARSVARVTVVASQDEVAVAVVADAPPVRLTQPRGVELTHDRDGDQLWLETRWTDA
ncbi:hypothetical protein [Actinokineospora diospyrosa]|uniref:Signal transduction histidine kinase n=1 Tax=Actinokineospora diospyrosa TaxID=103728 RepID=A0ABT1I851_9PSEU|nr:hypothetical protein [Actinokineospora diospyrosa]MCP2268810.1 Signal transduction histidine kinase [Actinokineospora diospyrosa]